jgi:hypothetical protein
MALDSNDLAMLHGMGFSPYEQVKIGYMQNKKASGTSIGALATAVGAGVLAIGGAAWAASRAQNAKDVAIAKNDGLKDLVQTLAGTLAAERGERIAGDLNITNTINDTVSGSQQGSLSQSQQLSNELTFGLMTGRYSENPQRVALYQDAKACPCPCSCGCNG